MTSILVTSYVRSGGLLSTVILTLIRLRNGSASGFSSNVARLAEDRKKQGWSWLHTCWCALITIFGWLISGAVGSGAVNPWAVDSRTVDPRAVDSWAIDPGAVGSRNVGFRGHLFFFEFSQHLVFLVQE